MKKYLLTIFSLILIYVCFLSWEPTNFEYDSFTYYLKVNKEIRETPAFNPSSVPLFIVRNADGVKPGMTIVNYCSSSDIREVKSHFINDGYKCSNEVQYDGLKCKKVTAKFDVIVIVGKGSSCTEIFKNYKEIQ